MLRRMHVNIHLMRIDIQIQHVCRLLIVFKLILIRLADRVINQAIFHHAVIHIAILHVCQAARSGRIGDPAADAQITVRPFNLQRVLDKCRAANARQTAGGLGGIFYRTVLADQLAVVTQIDGNVETRQRNTADDFINMGKFSFLSAHEFATSRCVVKQIQHFDGGTLRMRGRFHRHRHIASFGVGLPGFALICRARGQHQAGHRTDTRQRFAAKSEAQNGFQIVQTGNFAGGVTRQRQR